MEFKKEFLSNKSWWFSCPPEIDEYLASKYSCLLDDPDTIQCPLAKTLVLDQLPRHVFRNQPCSHVVSYFLEKALSVQIATDSLETEEWCFALLPLRHSLKEGLVRTAMKQGFDRLAKEPHNELVRRFVKATYERAPVFSSETFMPTETSFDDVLKNRESLLCFLPKKQPTQESIAYAPADASNRTLVISISGGVDSMVCSWLLHKHKNIAAVHVNYCNRETSNHEASFVKDWCSFLKIPLSVRNIPEIKRKESMELGLRDLYESYTRRARYSAYKEHPNPIVVLGHNLDDCIENCFTNIASRTKHNNLKGMEPFCEQDGLVFWRPLLGMPKKDIISYAIRNNIPFLPNSTPAWSMRGQIRDSIVPALNKWDARFVGGMLELSKTLSDMSETTNAFVDACVANTLRTGSNYEYHGCLPKTAVFWRAYIYKLCGENPSSKSISHLTERMVSKSVHKTAVSKRITVDIREGRTAILVNTDVAP